jgi:CheY-like chemotaxis protein
LAEHVNRKILIVEDEEAILELLSEIFKEIGDYTVLQARDGEEALRVAWAARPDVILLDIQLPKRNGYEVCKLIKSDSVMSHTKVLLISGTPPNLVWPKAREMGADGYIAKPFSSIMLVEKVEELLTGS